MAVAQNKSDFPNRPWVFETLQKLKKEGLMVGFDDRGYYGRQNMPETRYEWARASHMCYENLRATAKDLKCNAAQLGHLAVSKRSAEQEQQVQEEAKALKDAVATWEPDFTKLIREFRPEFKSFGADPDEMQHEVHFACSEIAHIQVPKPGSSLVQFRDVPRDHWAAKQVLELRKLGFIVGYPNGDSNTFVKPLAKVST